MFVADRKLLPALHISSYDRLGIQLAENEPLLVVAMVDEQPHLFFFCGLLIGNFDFDVLALLVFAHCALTVHFTATQVPSAPSRLRRD